MNKPKCKLGDTVRFILEGKGYDATIITVDKYGAGDAYGEEPCYDVASSDEKYITFTNPKGECRFKHLRDSCIMKELNENTLNDFIEYIEGKMPKQKNEVKVALCYKSSILTPEDYDKTLDYTVNLPVFIKEDNRLETIGANTVFLLDYNKNKGFNTEENINCIRDVIRHKKFYY